MAVNPESAAGSYEYKGEPYYFCSAGCLNRFRKDPEKFIKESTDQDTHMSAVQQQAAVAEPKAQTYTCPMHPEVKQDKAGIVNLLNRTELAAC
jgi:Cu+-exporting ATPase